MPQQVEEAATAIADFVAAAGADALLDEDGSGLLVEIPLDDATVAQLGRNRALGAWTLSVTRSLDRVPEEEVPQRLETLAVLTNRVRFGSGEIAGLTPEGHVSLTTVLSSTVDRAQLASLIARNVAVIAAAPYLDEPASGDGADATSIETMISAGWLRV